MFKKRISFIKNQSGFSLLEVILALAIFALSSTLIVSLTLGGFNGLTNSEKQIQATALAQEGLEAVRSIRDRAWNELIYNQSAVATTSTGWVLSGEGTSEEINNFSRVITFENVCRDIFHNLVNCPEGYQDVKSKKVNSIISWSPNNIATTSINYSTYLTNWNSQAWLQTDWSGGSGQNIWSDINRYYSDDGNIDYATAGEIKLRQVASNEDWFPKFGKTLIDTNEIDFNQGLFNGTMVIGSGTPASIVLDPSNTWQNHADSQATTTNLNSVSSLSSQEVWLAGDNGEIFQYNGTHWNEFANVGNSNLKNIKMTSTTSGWIAGSNGGFFKYNGTNWNRIGDNYLTETTDTDFNLGSFNNTKTSNTGSSSSVILNQNISWKEFSGSRTLTNYDLQSISAVDANNIWAVGNRGSNGIILYYNGSNWSIATTTIGVPLRGIDMFSNTNGWAVGNSGRFYRWNGTTWSLNADIGNAIVHTVDLIDANNGWAAGASGDFYRWNGTTWSLFSSMSGNPTIYSLNMISLTDGWATANSGRIYHWDGSAWSLNIDTGNQVWYSVKMTSANDGWITGSTGQIYRWNGASWNQFIDTGNETRYAIDMFGSSSGYLVGNNGEIRQWNGTTWTATSSPIANNFYAIKMLADNEGWIVGAGGVIVKLDLTYVPNGIFSSQILDSSLVNTVWQTTSRTQTLSNGSSLTIATRTGNTSIPDGTWSVWSSEIIDTTSITITSPPGRYLQYRATLNVGSDINQTPQLNDISFYYRILNQDFNSLAVISDSDIWLAGKAGVIIHYNGSNVSLITSPVTSDLLALDFISDSDIWAVGANGKILHYDGVSWSVFQTLTNINLNAIKMLSVNDGWIVSSDGSFYHYNGVTWSLFLNIGTSSLNSLDFVNNNDGWAIGNSGIIYHWNGTTWNSFSSPTTLNLLNVKMLSINSGWAIGASGLILKYDVNYLNPASFTSQVLDSGSVNVTWEMLYWDQYLASGANLTLAYRLGNTPIPDGTWSNWSAELSNNSLELINQSARQYFQYRITFNSNPNGPFDSNFLGISVIYNQTSVYTINDANIIALDNIWAVADKGKILQFNGNDWSLKLNTEDANLLAIDMINATDGWAVGQNGEIYHWNGTDWNLFQEINSINWHDIEMVSAIDGFLVGNNGNIYRYNGTTWNLMNKLGSTNWYSIKALSANNVWIVGDAGNIFHFNGINWSNIDTLGSEILRSLSFVSPTDGWVVGDSGLIAHWNGLSWIATSSPVGITNLNDIKMITANNGLIIGDNGIILQFKNNSWQQIDNPLIYNLYGVDLFSPNFGIIVGEHGANLLYNNQNETVTSGYFISSIFNLNDNSPVEDLEWNQYITNCASCALQIQMRVAPDAGGVPGVWSNWFGQGGENTYFTNSTGELIPSSFNWNHWLQYQVFFTSDGSASPILYEIKTDYK